MFDESNRCSRTGCRLAVRFRPDRSGSGCTQKCRLIGKTRLSHLKTLATEQGFIIAGHKADHSIQFIQLLMNSVIASG